MGPVSGLELVAWDMDGAPPRADEIRFVVPPYMGAAARIPALAHAPRAEVVQLLSAGYDDVLSQLPLGVRLANAAGVHDASTAELAVASPSPPCGACRSSSRHRATRWLPLQLRPALADKRVLIVGTALWAGPSLHG